MDFINEMKALASEHDVLKPEINSEATIKHIFNLTPKSIQVDFAKMKIATEGTMEERFQNIIKVLQEHKEDNLTFIALEDKPNETKPSPRTANSVVDHNNILE